jgi:hypothetical protein
LANFTSPGVFNGGTRTLTGIPPGAAAVCQVRVWDSSVASTYAAAVAMDAIRGTSAPVRIVPGTVAVPARLIDAGLSGWLCQASPVIYTQPTNQVLFTGENALFSVDAGNMSCGIATYQWRSNGIDIPGASTWEYAISNVQPRHAGNYSVVLMNRSGTTTSQDAQLIIRPPPVNDDFVNRIVLPSNSNLFSLSGTNLGATLEPGETNFLGSEFGGRSVWYSYTPPEQGLLRVLLTKPRIRRDVFDLSLSLGLSVNSLTQVGRSILIDDGHLNELFRALYADLLPGSEYKLAIDGAFDEGDTFAGGNFVAALWFVPSPSNDNFASASNIAGRDFSASLQFLAASREPDEPSHGDAPGESPHGGGVGSVWWRWDAPFNGLVTLRATQLGNFVPRLAVYEGNLLSALSNVPSTIEVIGHTRQLRFQATKGDVYTMAVCGAKFDTNSFPQIDEELFGSGKFDFNFASLALRISDLTTMTNASAQVVFSAASQIQNYGSVSSGPLRLRLIACPGVTKTEQTTGPNSVTNSQIELAIIDFDAPGHVLPGLSSPISIGGVCPSPLENSEHRGTGWEVFCLLEEQHGTNWFPQDKLLVLQGVWPSVRGYGGPGAGIIRLESELKGYKYDELLSVEILGPSPIYEGDIESYVGQAHFVVAPNVTFTNTVWNATRFAITNGVFRAGNVNADTAVGITARYAFAGQDYSTNRNILVLNLPPPSFVPSGLVSGSFFNLSLRGVPGRRHVIETTTNLNSSGWLPLATNVLDPLGPWNFVEPVNANSEVRFYRARELD